MNFLDDTIAAISTPIGEGGIGIVRLSGKNAISIADKIFSSQKSKKLKDAKSHTIVYGFINNPETGERIDEVLVSVMKAPHTYTKEDVVEINCHGGALPLRITLQFLLKFGARVAEAGEFTKRAFLNGRIDLSQAEAVIDIIRAKTEQAERLALNQLEGRLSNRIIDIRDRLTDICAHIEAYIDFPEDDIETLTKAAMIKAMQDIGEELGNLSKGYNEGRFFREGVSTAIVGKPNVGKSSLLNALLQKDRAIVTEIPGTTRDVIEGYLNISGLPLKVMDTAGIRETHDLAEMEGVKRSLKAIEGADIVIAVLDASRPLDDADMELIEKVRDKKTVFAINKSDIQTNDFVFHSFDNKPVINVSALKGEGIDELKNTIYSLCISSTKTSNRTVDIQNVLVTNIRHKQLIDMALDAIQAAENSLKRNEPLEVVALNLRESLDSLGEIVGAVTTEDILNRIFSVFCIGK
ncbi:MAG: tRNA uridine-5-carboxymethylaminomethyl(34) synthesis GTPase MnmE [Thermodesulfovibrionales bacterium]|nr:tRNA uridine-5-carboxymethylaminomethyl(34) synthesis GTPase MnmE [Thermodesulfovibrionales bacterium]